MDRVVAAAKKATNLITFSKVIEPYVDVKVLAKNDVKFDLLLF